MVLRKKVSHQAEKEAPGQDLQYTVIRLGHNNIHKGLLHGYGLQNNNCCIFMLAAMALFSGFTHSPLEESTRCVVLIQGRSL